MDIAVEAHLHAGEMEVLGRVADASNGTLYVKVHDADRVVPAVYKPVAEERPLWDFPLSTLSRREVATYRLASFLGLDVVPETVWRDGPAGMGSVQRWVGEEPSDAGMVSRDPGAGVIDLVLTRAVPTGWLKVFDGEDHRGRDVTLCHADDPRLAALAVLDVIANNADRKGGHVLAEMDGRLLGIDHGLTFNEEPKLRTVLWGWAGNPVPPALLEPAQRLVDDFETVIDELDELLCDDELIALERRACDLLVDQRFPQPGRGRSPAIPWPPF